MHEIFELVFNYKGNYNKCWPGNCNCHISKQNLNTNTYFISGHLNLTQDEFNVYYVPQIEKALMESSSKFIFADCEGSDTFTYLYFLELYKKRQNDL